ncbi:MAG: hypothetical protein WBD55_08030, partial [Dehalococcoidia bacterium]
MPNAPPEHNALVRAAEVCSLALLSIWLDKVDSTTPRSDEDKSRARREWASVLLDLYSDPSRRLYEWFLNWDVQYRADMSSDREGKRNPFPVSSMLADMCIEALGGPIAPTPTTGFPFRGLADYRQRGGGSLTCADPVAITAMFTALVDSHIIAVKI